MNSVTMDHYSSMFFGVAWDSPAYSKLLNYVVASMNSSVETSSATLGSVASACREIKRFRDYNCSDRGLLQFAIRKGISITDYNYVKLPNMDNIGVLFKGDFYKGVSKRMVAGSNPAGGTNYLCFKETVHVRFKYRFSRVTAL